MSTPRRLGVFLCIAGLTAICVLALLIDGPRGFNGLAGIESNLVEEARTIVGNEQAAITVDGRTLQVQLPDSVDAQFDREQVLSELRSIDGVRSVTLLGEPTEGPAPEPTGGPVPTVAPVADPTAAPEPAPEPTAAPNPEPTDEPAPDPTEAPTVEPVAPALEQVVGDLDLSGVEFQPGLAVLTDLDAALLDDIAAQLRGQSGGPIQVQAHTDNVGDPDANFFLSQNRAEAVTKYLIDRGVDPALLVPRGYGASLPVADNNTEQGRSDNQRVVFVVEGN